MTNWSDNWLQSYSKLQLYYCSYSGTNEFNKSFRVIKGKLNYNFIKYWVLVCGFNARQAIFSGFSSYIGEKLKTSSPVTEHVVNQLFAVLRLRLFHFFDQAGYPWSGKRSTEIKYIKIWICDDSVAKLGPLSPKSCGSYCRTNLNRPIIIGTVSLSIMLTLHSTL